VAEELTHLSAVELAHLVRTRRLSPVELTEAHLAAIARVNPAINAFCTVVPDKALAWARQAEAAVKKRGKLGPLHGVPVGIKDLTVTADIRTTFGSTLFRDHAPTEDVEVVLRIKPLARSSSGRLIRPSSGPAPIRSIRCSAPRAIRGTRHSRPPGQQAAASRTRGAAKGH
jgi:hypothetical protein